MGDELEFFAGNWLYYGYLVVLLPPGRRSRMPPNGRNWQVLTWSWACTTGHPASDQVLEAAADAAWPYALLCAWTFGNDPHIAHDLMDQAIQNATDYITRHPNGSSAKVNARVKSEIRRHAKHLAAKQRREFQTGCASKFEAVRASHPEIEQRIYANEIFAKLGYSWREIGRDMDVDYSEVRKAYFRELTLLLRNLSQSGESLKCD